MKSYTAIIKNEDSIRAVNMMVSPGDEREPDILISKNHPGYKLVALVPGMHAKWSHVYMTDENINAQRINRSVSGSSKAVDVWEVQNVS